MAGDEPRLRGIFAVEDEETPEWKHAIESEGQGSVPKFATKAECEEFIQKNCWRGSNPDFPNLQHIFSMLVDEQQIEEILMPKIQEYNERYPPQRPKDIDPNNRFVSGEGKGVCEGLDFRLNLPFHKEMTPESTYNTLKYLFHHMRCGIYVMIRQKRVVLFVPFANRDYENNWGQNIRFDSADGRMDTYYREKRNYYRRENIIDDPQKWWANGNIICNEHCRYRNKEHETQYWGDQFLTQLKDMLEDACKHRDIPDCEFFINKRDYPQLKNNRTEPYGFLFDKDDKNPDEDIPLQRHLYDTYAPIMSFYVSKRFADVPFPCSEDWEAATGLVFPQSFRHTHCDACPCNNPRKCENDWKCFCQLRPNQRKRHGIEEARDLFTATNFQKFAKPWEEKVDTAFFRGSATGGGTTIETNQRLHLAQLSNIWKHDQNYNGQGSDDHEGVPFLNAEVTTWNLRDKKLAETPMTFVRTEKFMFTAGRQHFIPIYQQSSFKYILYVEGHCAANRYAFLMRLGSVILKVESRCVADEMWYFPLLQPFEDHVPIKSDLSDLAEKIQWCRDNDDKCRQIAQRANDLYEQFVSRDAIRDYMELICHGVAQRFRPAPEWYTRPKKLRTDDQPHFPEVASGCRCRRCDETKDDDRQKKLSGELNSGRRGRGPDRSEPRRGVKRDRSRPRPARRSRSPDRRRQRSRSPDRKRRRSRSRDRGRDRDQGKEWCRRCRRSKAACSCHH